MTVGVAAPQTRSNQPAETRGATCALVALIGLGVLLELLLIFAVAQPLSLLAYPWPLAVSEPIAALLGSGVVGIRGFLLVSTACSGLYVLSYIVGLQCRGHQALSIVIAFSVLFFITLLFTYPAGARDVFTNIIDGRMRWLDGFNPMVSPPRLASHDPLFWSMTYWQDEPSYYGPVWYLLLAVPARAVRSDLVANLFAFRSLTLPFLVGSAYLAARVAESFDRRRGVAAAVLVGWSPLLLWESSVNGHNDVVLAFFALWALYLALQKHWVAALPLLALSIMTKYVTLILLPLFLIAAFRSQGRRVAGPVVIGSILALALGVLVLAPFWEGPATFSSLIQNGGNRFTSSPAALLATFMDGNAALPYYTSELAGERAKVITLILFSLAYITIALRLWCGSQDLLTSSFYSLFFFILLVSWWFWPWYVGWLVVIGGALVHQRAARLSIVFSVAALYGYAVLAWRTLLLGFETNVALPAAMVVVVFLPAVAYWLAGLPKPAWLAEALSEERSRSAGRKTAVRAGFAPLPRLPYNRDHDGGYSASDIELHP
ncbi:MAG: glycosyltransferase family 39 protein [Dehalococcoidia bacterium]